MERAGLVRPGDVYTRWVARTQVVPKPNNPTGDLRVVQDFRPVNDATLSQANQCHDIEQNLLVLGTERHSVYFQTDASNGFWAIGAHQDRQPKLYNTITPSIFLVCG